ncbi:MAG: IS200/IS605 family transposase [Deltaproteobacteria bacterium]|nr:IS200/IS605 family transposase [Deltaproteobacteria bacterium]
MPQSLARILLHITFSTKNREPCLTPDIQAELYRYIAGTLKELNCPAIVVGGYADHVHLLFVLSRNIPVSKLVEEVKKSSSKWIKTKGPFLLNFHWQNGYSAFSVSQSNEDVVRKYIEGQVEHHRKVTFQEELRGFLEKHKVAFDEKYVWD